MKTLITIVIALFAFTGSALADVSDCPKLETLPNYDYSKFQFKLDTNEGPWGDWYRYLLDQTTYKFLNPEKSRKAAFFTAVFLISERKAIVRYEEGEWEKTSPTSWRPIGTPLKTEFQTVWSVKNDKIHIEDLGNGIAIKCSGYPGVLLELEKNPGQYQVRGKKITLHYGGSNQDPFK